MTLPIRSSCRDAEGGYKLCTVCGFENFKRYQVCTICGGGLLVTASSSDLQDFTALVETSTKLSFLSSVFGQDNNEDTIATRRFVQLARKKAHVAYFARKGVRSGLESWMSKDASESVNVQLMPVSDPSIDASQLPVEIEIEPRLNILSMPLTETMTIASKDFPSKYTHFVMTASSLLVPAESGHMRLTLERPTMFEESMNPLATIPRNRLCSVMRINFVGESGVDAGEWFVMLNEMLVKPARGLFVCTNKSDQSYYMTPCSDQDILSQQLLHLFAAGRLFGRALLEGSMLCFHLAPPLLKLILGYPLGFADLEDLDPEVYANLRWLLENDGSDTLGLDLFKMETIIVTSSWCQVEA
ncbi:unnamed protein product [Phytophthora fragariaefolia]|uniref:HECT-type E3 ubiquitin transferase n=1 Tax=Phytophthora fragariaefolia TaxID=1490495 RepID=A0A9W6X805_9STRA|nr:unnamed protein product [Phytophthora fragariaefolia]